MSTDITIVGNLTGDPELRFTPSGAAVCNFNVAVNHRKFNRQTNEWEDVGTSFYRCDVWRQAAENVAESLTKGVQVVVTGDLKMEDYTRGDGSKGTSAKISVNHVGPSLQFATAKVTRAQRGEGNGGGGQSQQSSAPASDPWASPAGAQGSAPANDPWAAPAGGQGQPVGAAAGGDEPPF